MSDNQLPEATAEALHRAVRDLGRRVGESPDRVRAVLSDALGASAREHRSEIDALALASEEGIPSTLIGREESMLTESDVVLDDDRLRARLVERGLSDGAAGYAIGVWAAALGSVTSLSSTGGLTSAMSGPSVGSVSDPATGLPAEAAKVGTAGVVAAAATAAGVGGNGAGDDAGGILGFAVADDQPRRHRQVIPMGRRLVAGSAAAVLAIVAGAVWFSTSGDGTDRALLTDSALRSATSTSPTSTTSTSTTTATTPAAGATAPVTRTPVTRTPATVKSPVTKAPPTRIITTTPPNKVVVPPPSKAPTTKKVVVPPPPPPPAPKTLKAGNTSAAWTPKFYEDGIGQCVDVVPPHAADNICQARLNVVKGGTVTTWSISNAKSVKGHGAITISGHQIIYTPHHNGAFTDTVSYRLYGGGVYSNWATISVTVYCNEQMGCWG